MKRKIMLTLCWALLPLVLAGCRLAREDVDVSADEDRLAGVFITTEYLDLFDFEGYLDDNIGTLARSEVVIEGDVEQYQDRVYAALTTKTLTDEETGEDWETEEYTFEGLEGIPFFAVTVPASGERESYQTVMSDSAVSDVNTHYHIGDEAESTTIAGTINASPVGGDAHFYVNPVYQRADGSVYVTSGGGFMIVDSTGREGEQYAQTVEETYSVTENGETKSESISVKVSVNTMGLPERVVILQMDGDNKVLARTEYAPSEVPGTLSTEANAAYLIVETHKRDAEGNVSVARDIYGAEAESLETFSARADGICEKHWTDILWR